MREKAKDLVYLNTDNYVSLRSLRTLYWAIIILPLVGVIFGIAAINTIGVNWRSLFPFISIAVWNLLYWVLVLTLQSRKIKKTFELRFLVNGISGFLLSFLFWIIYATLCLFDDNKIIGFDFALWVLLFYVLCSALYIGWVVSEVHKGSFKKIHKGSFKKKKERTFFPAILPIAGTVGMYASKMIRAHASTSVQDILGSFALVSLVFVPILGHINFVQYYYCKKYKILCDESGNTTSPELEPRKRTGLPLIVKILICLLAVLILSVFIFFMSAIVVGIIRAIF